MALYLHIPSWWFETFGFVFFLWTSPFWINLRVRCYCYNFILWLIGTTWLKYSYIASCLEALLKLKKELPNFTRFFPLVLQFCLFLLIIQNINFKKDEVLEEYFSKLKLSYINILVYNYMHAVCRDKTKVEFNILNLIPYWKKFRKNMNGFWILNIRTVFNSKTLANIRKST